MQLECFSFKYVPVKTNFLNISSEIFQISDIERGKETKNRLPGGGGTPTVDMLVSAPQQDFCFQLMLWDRVFLVERKL